MIEKAQQVLTELNSKFVNDFNKRLDDYLQQIPSEVLENMTLRTFLDVCGGCPETYLAQKENIPIDV